MATFDSIPSELLLEVGSHLPVHYIWRLQRVCRRFQEVFSSTHAFGQAYDNWSTHDTGDSAPSLEANGVLKRANGQQEMLSFISGRPVAYTAIPLYNPWISTILPDFLQVQVRGAWLLQYEEVWGGAGPCLLHNLLTGAQHTLQPLAPARHQWATSWILTETLVAGFVRDITQWPNWHISVRIANLKEVPVLRWDTVVLHAHNNGLQILLATSAHKDHVAVLLAGTTTDTQVHHLVLIYHQVTRQCTKLNWVFETRVAEPKPFSHTMSIDADTKRLTVHHITELSTASSSQRRDCIDSIQYSFSGQCLWQHSIIRRRNPHPHLGDRFINHARNDAIAKSCGIKGSIALFCPAPYSDVRLCYGVMQLNCSRPSGVSIELETRQDSLLWKDTSWTLLNGRLTLRRHPDSPTSRGRRVKDWETGPGDRLLALNDSYLVFLTARQIVVWTFSEAAYQAANGAAQRLIEARPTQTISTMQPLIWKPIKGS